jgi:hypothetical protein
MSPQSSQYIEWSSLTNFDFDKSTLQEAFTNEAIKAIYTTLHPHAINALAKNNSVSNVDNLLSGWTEHENVSQMWQSNPQFSDLKQAKKFFFSYLYHLCISFVVVFLL